MTDKKFCDHCEKYVTYFEDLYVTYDEELIYTDYCDLCGQEIQTDEEVDYGIKTKNQVSSSTR